MSDTNTATDQRSGAMTGPQDDAYDPIELYDQQRHRNHDETAILLTDFADGHQAIAIETDGGGHILETEVIGDDPDRDRVESMIHYWLQQNPKGILGGGGDGGGGGGLLDGAFGGDNDDMTEAEKAIANAETAGTTTENSLSMGLMAPALGAGLFFVAILFTCATVLNMSGTLSFAAATAATVLVGGVAAAYRYGSARASHSGTSEPQVDRGDSAPAGRDHDGDASGLPPADDETRGETA